MKITTVLASLLATTVAADEWTIWELYCGDSCDSASLVLSGDLETNVTTTCTAIGATYEYCKLDYIQAYGSYAINLGSSESSCDTLLDEGSCTAAGSYSYYSVDYYF